MAKLDKKISEPSILVKPISRFGGLDNIHIALIALVVILILLVVAVSHNTTITVVNATNGTKANVTNSTPGMPIHTAAQAKMQAERILASYADLNNSLALLPYLSDVNGANVSYIQGSKQWYVSIPYVGPANGKTYLFAILMSDANLSKFSTFAQDINPNAVSQNYVVSQGVVKLYGRTSCTSTNNSVPVYLFMDPYAPGSIQSLHNVTGLEQKFGNKVNVSIKILSTQYSLAIADSYGGLNNSLQLGKYLLCASTQRNFTGFVNAVNSTYQGKYVPAYLLEELAGQAGLNTTSLSSCVASSQGIINAQFTEAQYYNITSSPAVLTSCEYLSIPQTAQNAVCYSNPSIC